MKKESIELFKKGDMDTILLYLKNELEKRNESPIWKQKVIPFSEAILSVLVPLQKQGLLFDPQGYHKDELSVELFFEWSDFLSLKTLAFTLQKSNEASRLLRTKIDEEKSLKYKNIELDKLATYLASNRVNLQNEYIDFPISAYNLHQGVSNVIKSLL